MWHLQIFIRFILYKHFGTRDHLSDYILSLLIENLYEINVEARFIAYSMLWHVSILPLAKDAFLKSGGLVIMMEIIRLERPKEIPYLICKIQQMNQVSDDTKLDIEPLFILNPNVLQNYYNNKNNMHLIKLIMLKILYIFHLNT